MRKRGWASGLNVQFDERWTIDNMELIRSAATNLVELNPDVILAVGGRVIPILMKLTRSIPIVIPGGSDPVARGYVDSLARPGGNVTGFAGQEDSIIGKQLQTLKEIAPDVVRVTMIHNPDNPSGAFAARAFEAAARPLGVDTAIVHIHGLSDIEHAMAVAADGHLDASEYGRIRQQLRSSGLNEEEQLFLSQIIMRPSTIEELAAAAATPELKVEVYAAARLAIDPDSPAERNWLDQLAAALKLETGLTAHLDAIGGAKHARAA